MPCRKEQGGSGGHQAECKPAMCLCSKIFQRLFTNSQAAEENASTSIPRQVIHLLSTDKTALGFPVQERHGFTGTSPAHHECDERLGHVTQRERLSRLVLFSWKRWLGPKYLKIGRCKQDRTRFFLIVSRERTRAKQAQN